MLFSINEKQKILKSFGAKVKQKRNDIKISQESLADLSGLHRTYIGSVERGERNITIINIFRIAKALKCSISELISEDFNG